MILIAGPTASGKSQLGVNIARQCHGVVINADSMQVYDVLHFLSARPYADQMAGIAHFLYGFVSPAEAFSTGRWLEAVRDVLHRADVAGRTCVFVGGTGLYFRALLGGLAAMPPVEAAVRQKWRRFLQDKGAGALYERLQCHDPVMAQRLCAADGQRMIRAFEVLETSGRSLAEWQQQRGVALIDPRRVRKLVLTPQRDVLAARINARFDRMIAKGAVEEVRQLRALRLDPALPVMKAIGVRQLSACLDGAMTLESAIEQAKTETRRYAKRQMTWQRHQFAADWRRFSSAEAAQRSFQQEKSYDMR